MNGGNIIWASGLDSTGDVLVNAGDTMGMLGSGSIRSSCSGSGPGSGSLNCSMDENPWQ